MSATPADFGLETGGSQPVSPEAAARPTGLRVPHRAVVVMSAALLADFLLAGATVAGRPAELGFGLVPPPQPYVAPLLPSEPVDGALILAIPPGAAADRQTGGRGYAMPDVIRLHVGDTIVLRNDDDAPHMILYAFLMPAETDERTCTKPGSEVYSSGCGVHAASFLNFTTIFVAEAAGTGPNRSA